MTALGEHSENLSGFVLVDKRSRLEVDTSDKVLGNTELLLCHRVHATCDAEREWLVEHSRPLSSNTLLAVFVTDTDKHECFASNATASKENIIMSLTIFCSFQNMFNKVAVSRHRSSVVSGTCISSIEANAFAPSSPQ